MVITWHRRTPRTVSKRRRNKLNTNSPSKENHKVNKAKQTKEKKQSSSCIDNAIEIEIKKKLKRKKRTNNDRSSPLLF
jgi:hypothetical protein